MTVGTDAEGAAGEEDQPSGERGIRSFSSARVGSGGGGAAIALTDEEGRRGGGVARG